MFVLCVLLLPFVFLLFPSLLLFSVFLFVFNIGFFYVPWEQGEPAGTPQHGGRQGLGQSGTAGQPPADVSKAASNAPTMSARGVGGTGGAAAVLPTSVSKKHWIQQSEPWSSGAAQPSKHAPSRCATTALIILSLTHVAFTCACCCTSRHQQSLPSTSPGALQRPTSCDTQKTNS